MLPAARLVGSSLGCQQGTVPVPRVTTLALL
jgi:hypothetical protein